jgi:long-chain fatty acid transport protein
MKTLEQNSKPGWQKAALITLLALSTASTIFADGIDRDGVGAKSMSLGGADVAWPEDPLTSLSSNPAGLGFLQGNKIDLGADGVLPTGHFSNRAGTNGQMDSDLRAFPEGAAGFHLGKLPVTLGIGFYPESGLLADWHYNDVPGGTGGTTTYGYQEYKSEIIVLRTAFGMGIQITPQLSIGGSVGLIYNQNQLVMPYIFQNEPTLPLGFKTLLNLQTEGWGADGNFGIQYHPVDNLQLGVSYKTESRVVTTGNAYGDANTQLANLGLGGANPAFHYDAEVVNVFPQSVSTGFAWKFQPQWTLSGQIDWVDWSSFNSLPVRLTNGGNPDINGVVGSNTLNDQIPLKWSDRLVYRTGIEYAINDNWSLRAGYIFGKSPVPDSTLTPLTAVITENTLTTGIGYQHGAFGVDLAYQYALPISRTVTMSQLEAGEANGSTVKISIHTFALTASYKF